jgi:hypothetical protein
VITRLALVFLLLVTRLVLDSLPLRYASVLRTIETLDGRKLRGVPIVGGGITVPIDANPSLIESALYSRPHSMLTPAFSFGSVPLVAAS